uniref:Uncharacterized protein n=1 Tax=Bicosoecida sp. CB-2014 TaxID=1486930 RepID=A0A7S1CDQ5_9STRA|mmetsp:Transcript_21175/g.74676  ORF Transcript_21175/g.74676 Transcript_21175/m.74676 type:complete len:488 (+) Transcript_21175:134-1597(+)
MPAQSAAVALAIRGAVPFLEWRELVALRATSGVTRAVVDHPAVVITAFAALFGAGHEVTRSALALASSLHDVGSRDAAHGSAAAGAASGSHTDTGRGESGGSSGGAGGGAGAIDDSASGRRTSTGGAGAAPGGPGPAGAVASFAAQLAAVSPVPKLPEGCGVTWATLFLRTIALFQWLARATGDGTRFEAFGSASGGVYVGGFDERLETAECGAVLAPIDWWRDGPSAERPLRPADVVWHWLRVAGIEPVVSFSTDGEVEDAGALREVAAARRASTPSSLGSATEELTRDLLVSVGGAADAGEPASSAAAHFSSSLPASGGRSRTASDAALDERTSRVLRGDIAPSPDHALAGSLWAHHEALWRVTRGERKGKLTLRGAAAGVQRYYWTDSDFRSYTASYWQAADAASISRVACAAAEPAVPLASLEASRVFVSLLSPRCWSSRLRLVDNTEEGQTEETEDTAVLMLVAGPFVVAVEHMERTTVLYS